jgi:uncharacterized protein (TIGR02145 family)
VFIRKRRAFWVAMAAAAVAVLCCGCSDNGIGGAFVIARNGGKNDCGKDGTAGSCKTVVIGGKTWMAENLNYKPSSGNSWCYDGKESYCDIYGRLYDWSTAMEISTSYNSSKWGGSDVKHQGICPSGWHLPSRKDWETLVDYAGSSAAYKKLKSAYGWRDDSGDGTDDFGFSALPGGYRYFDGNFYDAGYLGNWWTATEYDGSNAYNWDMGSYYDGVNNYHFYNYKSNGYSVRCVKN